MDDPGAAAYDAPHVPAPSDGRDQGDFTFDSDLRAKSASAAFVVGASEAASFVCRLDAGDWAACASPGEKAGLADGEHTFQARATDRAGNVGPEAAYTGTVDTVAPVTTIDDAPASPHKDRAPQFEFSADETAGFVCAGSPRATGPPAQARRNGRASRSRSTREGASARIRDGS